MSAVGNIPITTLITGAGGFIGRHTVAAARARGHRVHALLRNAATAPADWADDPGISIFGADLAGPAAADVLKEALRGVDAVIHAAASLSGDDARQLRDTGQVSAALLDGLAAGPRPRLVLVSSLAVYDVSGLPVGGMLDETTPLETRPERRDAYCRSKLAQEDAVLGAARTLGLDLHILRPGVVFGPGRLWNGHLGLALGPVVLRAGRGGQVPCSHVTHCAAALVLAAERPAQAPGRVEVINVVDDDLPDRARYLRALGKTGWPRLVIPGHWRILAALAAMLSFGGVSERRLPGLLRPAIVQARLKPLIYGNARLRESLGWRPVLSFEEAMAHD